MAETCHKTMHAVGEDAPVSQSMGYRKRFPSTHGPPRDAREAKRALRRRIKAKRWHYGEWIAEPGPLFDQPHGVPKLPRGGDGLAVASLRPSLVQRPRDGRRVASNGPPRRPASSQLRPSLSAHSDNRSRLRSMSAPPIVGGTETKTDGRHHTTPPQQGTQDRDEEPVLFHQEEVVDRDSKNSRHNGQEFRTPVPPAGVKRAGQTYTDAGHRTTRSVGSSTCAEDQSQFVAQASDGAAESVPHEQETLSVGHEVRDRQARKPYHETARGAEAESEDSPPLEEERGASVVLASTVLLSPRGRSRNPTVATNRSYFMIEGEGAALDGGPDEWIEPPRARTITPDASFSVQLPQESRNLLISCDDERPWVAATDTGRPVVSEVCPIRSSYLQLLLHVFVHVDGGYVAV